MSGEISAIKSRMILPLGTAHTTTRNYCSAGPERTPIAAHDAIPRFARDGARVAPLRHLFSSFIIASG